ncbi:hypothetical protein [Pedobacter montanisoli]|uniref:Type II secretion system protein GspC N-terminal domain-containing protein n=1 Tax=Pedobacter montanisoli TaxID=2923277 RepID=A0ABS9ZZG0_9SPHI|nr:hypothetical protein [Pedobacter montanisoli]MCJ0743687.1 hypothetical protein [Pedobacter montanisoli]
MKNKALTYLLIICVAAVWGVIFYRVYAGLSDEELPSLKTSTVKSAYFNEINHLHDTVTLNLNYPDPFFTSSSDTYQEKKVSEDVLRSPAVVKTPPVQKPVINWAAIQYTGYINNPANKQKLAMLNIQGKEALLAEGQSANGLKLIKHLGDSVRVQFQGETKYIRIK